MSRCKVFIPCFLEFLLIIMRLIVLRYHSMIMSEDNEYQNIKIIVILSVFDIIIVVIVTVKKKF